jgi:hypothetical protein
MERERERERGSGRERGRAGERGEREREGLTKEEKRRESFTHNLFPLSLPSDGSGVDYFVVGGGHKMDTSTPHSRDVPIGSSKFVWPTKSKGKKRR